MLRSLWWEFVLYLGALVFLATAFASAIACLPQTGEFVGGV